MNTDNKNRKSVLIIDDDRALVEEFSKKCESMGLEVLTASDARGASEVFDRNLPDLLMYNVDLKAGNDRTFIECLENYEDTCSIPAILLRDEPVWEPPSNAAMTLGYHVHKCVKNWWRVEMFINELIDLDSSLQDSNPSAEN